MLPQCQLIDFPQCFQNSVYETLDSLGSDIHGHFWRFHLPWSFGRPGGNSPVPTRCLERSRVRKKRSPPRAATTNGARSHSHCRCRCFRSYVTTSSVVVRWRHWWRWHHVCVRGSAAKRSARNVSSGGNYDDRNPAEEEAKHRGRWDKLLNLSSFLQNHF